MKNIFLLLLCGTFICGNVFSQSDSTCKKSFRIGVKIDGTLERYRIANDEGLRMYQAFEMAEGIISTDPAIVISYKRNSLSIGPKVFLVNSGTIASGGNWRGLRANYQYTFINPSRKCNLLLFYEFSAIKYFNESSSGYGDHMVTRISFKNYINHEIGIGTRYKLLKSFYLNSSYAIGICLNKSYTTISGPLICTIPFDFPPYSVNRLTGFFRVGLQYDFNL